MGPSAFNKAKHQIGESLDVPIVVANDGAVAALAVSMSYEVPQVLAGALGTSTALGGTTKDGNLTSELYEGAFMTVDCRPSHQPIDPWSGANVAERYLDQFGAMRLARGNDIGSNTIDDKLPVGDQLKALQGLAESCDRRAIQTFWDMGRYIAHSVPFYLNFWPPPSDGKIVVQFLGRVMSGFGGNMAYESQMEEIGRILDKDLLSRIIFPKPGSEEQMRHGQASAAASLPYM